MRGGDGEMAITIAWFPFAKSTPAQAANPLQTRHTNISHLWELLELSHSAAQTVEFAPSNNSRVVKSAGRRIGVLSSLGGYL